MKEKILELINKYNKLEVGYECDKTSSRLQCDVAIDLCSNFKNDMILKNQLLIGLKKV